MEQVLSTKSQNSNIRLAFEVGHRCEDVHTSTSQAGRRVLTCDWRMWVRSASGHDISSIVQKIVFKIRPENSIASTIKVIDAPPYILQESTGCNSVNIHIYIHIKVGQNNIIKIKFKYFMDIKKRKKRPINKNRVYYDFVDASDDLKERLLECGGEVIRGVSVAPLTTMMDMMEM